jgi:hypothetical protein
MNRFVSILFPPQATRTLRGNQLPFYFFILIAVVGTVRSFIHILAPDGGAESIAGMDLTVTGASGIILAFALWGSSQLVYVVIQWIVLWRYRSLIPLMWGIQLFETLGRMFVGRIKPVTFAHTPPGAYENYIYVVLALVMLGLSLWSIKSE